MPSNAMKISHLIQALEGLRGFHGDLDVVLALPGDSACVAIDGRNINVAVDLPWQKLPAPCLVIGMWQDQAGRLTNMPGAKYEATADAGDWNYSRADAPEGETLDVWKRYGGQGVGRREGDRWFVDEGDRRGMTEIVAAGILGWKRQA